MKDETPTKMEIEDSEQADLKKILKNYQDQKKNSDYKIFTSQKKKNCPKTKIELEIKEK